MIGNHFFMEDNARPHMAASTQTYLENRGIPKIGWPSQSPDLNPIENVWLKMKREIARKKKYLNQQSHSNDTTCLGIFVMIGCFKAI